MPILRGDVEISSLSSHNHHRHIVTLCIHCLPSLGLSAMISRSAGVKLYFHFE